MYFVTWYIESTGHMSVHALLFQCQLSQYKSNLLTILRMFRFCLDNIKNVLTLFRLFKTQFWNLIMFRTFSKFLAQILVYSEFLDFVVQATLEEVITMSAYLDLYCDSWHWNNSPANMTPCDQFLDWTLHHLNDQSMSSLLIFKCTLSHGTLKAQDTCLSMDCCFSVSYHNINPNKQTSLSPLPM
jgi:hypothetical protein